MSISFKKAVWLEVALIALLVGGYFSGDLIAYLKKRSILYTPSNGCELNKQDCELKLLDGSLLTASVDPKAIYPLQKAKFTTKIEGASGVKAIVKGLNMEMGVHEYEFKKSTDGVFEASILLPSCSIDMKWQFDVIVSKQNGDYGGGFIVWSKNQ